MNIATIGTGFIVDTFLAAAKQIKDIHCVAMYSRNKETAQPLAEKYGIPVIYTELDALMADPKIDFVYIASPNSLHCEHATLALEHGKHVICEKPFTSTVAELDRLIALAKHKNLMLFEAITTLHLPNYQLAKEQLAQLGAIKFIQCNYSQYSSRYNQLLNGETPNVFSTEFSGGALTDINIYNLHFVMNMFGAPQSVSYTANKHPNGIDTSGILVLKYSDFIAQCVGCKDTNSMNFVLIQGEKGYLHVEHGANGCRKLILHANGRETLLNAQTNENLLYYELTAFKQMYQAQDYQQCHQLLDHSRSVIETVVQARQDAQIVFAADTL
ncbi:Gfo/Idh/MocA family protein [Paenibacillus lentus]|uniref:Gfo/Idh/MocA family oxidoreductase n=1 Tax=Paenibacillus lentus TaxID=1338368 RepID=A0A3S8RXJ0_9BACL|nr:Gfo/Idh/MocA family oxidoreductase [Paenibacillus lentus]AZK47584.1 gfo/Idh/MocA family oxidoreductase [Paenibacillus lentus]